MARLFTSTIERAAEVRAAGFDTLQGTPRIATAPTGETSVEVPHNTTSITLAKKTGITYAREVAYFCQIPTEISATPSAAEDCWKANGACRLRITTGRILQYQDSANTVLASTQALEVNRKYVIEVMWKQMTSTTGEWELRVDGVSKGSGRAANIGAATELLFGKNNETVRTGFIQYTVPDVKLNDSTGASQTSWPTSASSFEGAASLGGEGRIAATGPVTHMGADVLRGVGSLASGGRVEFKNGARASGTGTLAATGPVTHMGAAALRGAGTLVPAGYVTHRAEAPLRGAGTLVGGTGRVARNFATGATLAGSSSLTAGSSHTSIAVAVLSGLGSVAGTGPVSHPGASASSAAGTLASTGVATHIGAAALASAGALSAGGVREKLSGARCDGVGTLTGAPGTSRKTGEAVLRGIGSLLVANLAGYFAEIAMDFPAAWFHLDETRGTEARDAEGGAAGSYNGEYTLNQSGLIFAETNASAAFRRNAYVRVADRLAVDPGDNFTIECWIYPTAYGDGSGLAATFFDKGAGAFIFRFADVKDGTFILRRNEVATIVTSTARILLNQISHVVAKKAGEAVKLFLNGRDVTGVVTNSTMVTNELPLTIGAADNGTHNFFTGRIDEVAIYPTGLEDSRIIAHYNAGKAPVVGEAVLSGVGTMAGGSGAIGRVAGAVLAGSGALGGGAGFKTANGTTATLAGTSSMIASGFTETSTQAVLAGSGRATATGRKDYSSGAALGGSGALSGGNGRKLAKGSATAPGAGALIARTTTGREGAATLEGRGALASGPGFRSAQSTAAGRSEGTLTGTGRVSHVASAVLFGAGTANANGTRTANASAALHGSGSMTTNSTRSTVSASRLSGVGTLSIAGHGRVSGEATLVGAGSMTVREGVVNAVFPGGFLSLHVARAELTMEVS